MKGPSDALPNTLSLGGSIRTRLTETAVFTAFPTVVQFPSPPLWEAAGFSCLQTRCTFLSDISASSPGPPGRLQTAQLHLEENKHQVPIVTQMLEDHLHTHVCWVSFFSNGKSWSIFKLQRRLSKKKKKTTFHSNLSETWGADQVTDGMGQHTPPPAAFGSLVQGTVPGVCGVCPPSWGTAKAQDRPKEEWCKTQGSRMAPGSLRYTLILCYITQHP